MDSTSSVMSIMSTRVISVSPDADIAAAATLMVQHGVSGLPVIDGGRLVGIVTETDLVSREIDIDPPVYGTFLDAVFRFPWDRTDEEFQRVLATTVGELMTEHVLTVSTNATISDVANLMFKQGANPVPVVDDAGRVVGIVSRSDIVRMIAQA